METNGGGVELLLGDCLEVMRGMPDNCVDAVVTDPPYGLSFMGKKWDYDVPTVELWREVLRVLKPGGHLLSFGGTRTYHRLACNVEDAGFEVRDQIQWLFGSGFPKSLDVSKAIDKAAGAEREIVGKGQWAGRGAISADGSHDGWKRPSHDNHTDRFLTAPATDAAKTWQGWGTALKPANEPILLARKPLSEKTVAANVLKWGTGALNIDGCRIEFEGKAPSGSGIRGTGNSFGQRFTNGGQLETPAAGRFPANLILDEGAAEMLDAQSGELKTGGYQRGSVMRPKSAIFGHENKTERESAAPFSTGGASRFFYVAKASRRERNAGLDGFERISVPFDSCDGLTAAVPLLQKVTSESTIKWLIGESGKSITALFPRGCRSTISTAIKQIIESKTLSYLMHSLTNESTRDVNSKKASGGNRAESVAILKKFLLATTNESTELALGAVNAASRMLQAISESAESPLSNFHATVKPVTLMRYLVRLVTPPGGTVLDPFMGSGTTGIAAVLEGFGFVGIERDAEYLEIAKRRVHNTKIGGI